MRKLGKILEIYGVNENDKYIDFLTVFLYSI